MIDFWTIILKIQIGLNLTARFKKCKQLFEYQHLLLRRDICWSKFQSILYFNVVHFFYISVMQRSVAAPDSCFLAWVSDMLINVFQCRQKLNSLTFVLIKIQFVETKLHIYHSLNVLINDNYLILKTHRHLHFEIYSIVFLF